MAELTAEEYLLNYDEVQVSSPKGSVYLNITKITDPKRPTYRLEIHHGGAGTCTCPDAICRKKRCKHIKVMWKMMVSGGFAP